jgi:hypothetical protein
MAECDNCGRTLGKLETPQNWQQHTVCEECFGRLSAPRASLGNYSKLSRGGIVQYGRREGNEMPRIFKWAAWLIVIVILLFLFDYIGHYYSRQADLHEEEFRLNQH